MTFDSRNNADDGGPRSDRAMADGWLWIAGLAGRAVRPAAPAVSGDFVEGVLARLVDDADAVSRRRDERLVLLTAGCALAAALLLAVWSWPEIRVALGDPAPAVDALVRVEPWL